MRTWLLFLFASCWISSCSSNYFVDSIATPVFRGPWHGDVQVNATTNGKYYFEGNFSLPCDLVVTASREFWGHGLNNDQELSNLTVGHFWPLETTSLFVGGGFGEGSQRIGPNYPTNSFLNNNIVELLNGESDFRKYDFDMEYAWLDTIRLFGPSFPVVPNTFGIAGRLEYLDRYHYSQSIKEGPDSTAAAQDTVQSFDIEAKHSLSFDVAFFASTGVSFLQLYGQLLLRIPMSGYFEFSQALVATAGLKIAF